MIRAVIDIKTNKPVIAVIAQSHRLPPVSARTFGRKTKMHPGSPFRVAIRILTLLGNVTDGANHVHEQSTVVLIEQISAGCAEVERRRADELFGAYSRVKTDEISRVDEAISGVLCAVN